MILYFLIINILGFIICVYDKYLAKRKKFRISEKLLLTVSALGGAIGFYIGMKYSHHKTKSKDFLIKAYPILFIWIFLYFYILFRRIS